MAQLIEGDSRGLHRGLIGNPPGLPPRFPTLSNRGLSSLELDNSFYSNQGKPGTLGRYHGQHNRTPSCYVVMQNQQFLVDNQLEQNEVSTTKALHRRSASDPFTHLENSGNFCTFSNIAEGDESVWQREPLTEKVDNQANEDGDQLLDLLEEIQQLQQQQNLPISARSQVVHHNYDSSFVNTTGHTSASLEAAPGHLLLELKGGNLEDGENHVYDSVNGDPVNDSENDLDTKKSKRVLANRQSAQRSRVRKLQYIVELERIVSTLQTEVSSLSLQLIYLKHQRALLIMDNNALKQQAVFFVQEKRSKDSQNEILMHDIRRLQKLSEFQLLHKLSQMQKHPPAQHHHMQRHSSLPSDFVSKLHQFEELNTAFMQTKAEASSVDGLTKDFGGISLDTGLSRERLSRNLDSNGVGTASVVKSNTALTGELFDSKEVAYDT